MKLIMSLLLLFLVITTNAQQHKLEKIWETDTVIAVPESVLLAGNILYVSLIDGGGWDADGKGGIAKLDVDGKIINTS